LPIFKNNLFKDIIKRSTVVDGNNATIKIDVKYLQIKIQCRKQNNDENKLVEFSRYTTLGKLLKLKFVILIV